MGLESADFDVILGKFDINGGLIYEGEKSKYDDFEATLLFEDKGTYNLTASFTLEGDDIFTLTAETKLSSDADMKNFINPDKNGIEDIEEFFESMEENIEDVAQDIVKDVDPDLFDSLSKNNDMKTCQSNIRIIKSNLSTYLITGNDGEQFDSVEDALANQKTFKSLFYNNQIPRCYSGGSSGTDYEIYIYDDFSYTVTCTNPKCPNCGK